MQARANAPVQRTLHAEEACEVSRREGEQLAAINLVEQEGCFMLPQLQSAQPLPDLGASNHQGENIPSTSPCGIHNCNPHMSCCSPSTTLLPTTLMHLRTTVGQNAIAAKPFGCNSTHGVAPQVGQMCYLRRNTESTFSALLAPPCDHPCLIYWSTSDLSTV